MDIEDANIGIGNGNHHNDRGYKENSKFNGIMESVAEEFKNAMDGFATVGDIDKFKKCIQKKYKYTLSNAEFIGYTSIYISTTSNYAILSRRRSVSRTRAFL